MQSKFQSRLLLCKLKVQYLSSMRPWFFHVTDWDASLRKFKLRLSILESGLVMHSCPWWAPLFYWSNRRKKSAIQIDQVHGSSVTVCLLVNPYLHLYLGSKAVYSKFKK